LIHLEITTQIFGREFPIIDEEIYPTKSAYEKLIIHEPGMLDGVFTYDR